MPNLAASSGLLSVSTLASRILGSNSWAAWAKAGAIERQGPHHGAQKSTTTGRSFRLVQRSKSFCVNSCGRPQKMGFLHWPQIGASPSRDAGRRLTAEQCEQTRCRLGVMVVSGVYQKLSILGLPSQYQVLAPCLKASLAPTSSAFGSNGWRVSQPPRWRSTRPESAAIHGSSSFSAGM